MRARGRDVSIGHRSVTVATLALGLAACTSFGSDSGSTPADADGGVSAAEAGTACGIDSPFVETFDGSLSSLWSAAGSSVAHVATGGRSGGMEEVTLPGAPSALSIGVSASCVVDAVAYIRMGAVGDGEVDLFVLSETPDASGAVLGFVRNNNANAFAFEDPGHVVTTVPTLPSGWLKVELQIDTGARTYAATISTEAGARLGGTNGSLASGWPKGQGIWVKIGAPYAAGVTQNWSVDFDDVTVMATPTK